MSGNLLYCSKCNNLFNPEYIYHEAETMRCPIVECQGNAIFEIDELIVYQVRELNKMGYITDCSCSGHIQEVKAGYCGSYILFKKYYNIIENVVKKYLDDGIKFEEFTEGRWMLKFTDDYVETHVGIPPDYTLLIAFVDMLNKLIHHLRSGRDGSARRT